jgi:hypothetical protein
LGGNAVAWGADNGGLLADDIPCGQGLKCNGWRDAMDQAIAPVLAEYARDGNLCFKAAGVEKGSTWMGIGNFHAWFQVYKISTMPMTLSNHGLTVDPWPTGGEGLTSGYKAERFEKSMIYYE